MMNVDRGNGTEAADLPELEGPAAIDNGQLTGFEFRQSTQNGSAE
jgi:hypothetical protein